MGVETKIQWTHHTFNPWRGCTKVSPGCTNCYAETLSHRNPGVLGIWGDKGTRVIASESMWREPPKWDREAREAGVRRRVFCASLADVFEDRRELIEPRERLWDLIERTPNLDWLLLTKRPENWRRCWPLVPVPGHVSQNAGDGKTWQKFPNIWMGASVEDQQRADERIPALLQIPAAVRFLSVEPLLGPIDLGLHRVAMPKHRESWPTERVRNFWVIAGGESGKGARECNLAWIRSIRDQCKEAGTAFFCKQLGSNCQGYWLDPNAPGDAICYHSPDRGWKLGDPKGGDIDKFPHDLRIREFPAVAEVPA